jgi:predicted Zn-dependent protease
MRPLTDAEKLGRQPSRLRVIEVTQASTTLAAVARATPELAVSLEEIALLNAMGENATVRRGTRVKMVTGGANGEVSAR